MEPVVYDSSSPPPPSSDEKNWAMLCHLGAFAGFVIPFANVFVPLGVWLFKKDTSGFVDAHGKEVVNFQITLTGILALCTVLYLLLIGFMFHIIFMLFGVVVTVLGATKAQNGERYRYPMTLRLVK